MAEARSPEAEVKAEKVSASSASAAAAATTTAREKEKGGSVWVCHLLQMTNIKCQNYFPKFVK